MVLLLHASLLLSELLLLLPVEILLLLLLLHLLMSMWIETWMALLRLPGKRARSNPR